MSKMTNVDAQAILTQLAELEFPRMYETALQFALFKVQYPASIAQLKLTPMIDLWDPHDLFAVGCYSGVLRKKPSCQKICRYYCAYY